MAKTFEMGLLEAERSLSDDRRKQIERFIKDVFHIREVPEDDASAVESRTSKR